MARKRAHAAAPEEMQLRDRCAKRAAERDGVPLAELAEALGATLAACPGPAERQAVLVAAWYGQDPVRRKPRRGGAAAVDKDLLFTCDAYRCPKEGCRLRKCRYIEVQTRSCDEPPTHFIECICGHRWRRG